MRDPGTLLDGVRQEYKQAGQEYWFDQWYSRNLAEVRWLLNQLEKDGTPPRLKVLDLGVGWGGASVVLAQLGHSVVGLDDFADDLMGQGNAQMTFLRTMQVHVVRAKLSAMPFPDQTFHAVIVNDVLEHLAIPKRLMGRIYKLLLPGGLVILEVPNAVALYKRIKVVFGQSNYFRFENFYQDKDYRGHIREYTKLEVRQMLRESGFQPLQCVCINQARRPRFEQANARQFWAAPLLSCYHFGSSLWDTWRDHICCVGRKAG